MLDWILEKRYRFATVLFAYFGLHVVIRVCISGSLDFDESEQAFLSQWFSLGYNSQPPLYTWMQTALFHLFGYGVMPLALLKNVLLALTYLCVFGTVRKATGNAAMALVASLAMMTIPQIAWESHRDLSHTVAVTFAVSLLVYCVVSLRHQPHWKWYVAIGLTCGFGLMSKYNFGIVILAVMAAAVSVPSYRRWLLDRRLILSVVVATVLIAPHTYWAVDHLQLASSKTISTLTREQTDSWGSNVSHGVYALVTSTLACCLLTLAIFLVAFRDSLKNVYLQWKSNSIAADPTTLLIERFLLIVAIALMMLVLSGHALEFKNRWIQPFACLFPAYLMLRVGRFANSDRVAMNRVCISAVTLMAVVLIAIVARPMLSQKRNKFIWLNIPYPQFAETIENEIGEAPAIIITPHMHSAGNLKLQFPNSLVIAMDQRHLVDSESLLKIIARGNQQVVVATDVCTPSAHEKLSEFAIEIVGQPTDQLLWRSREYRYLYGDESANTTLGFARLEHSIDPIAAIYDPLSASDRIGALPQETATH
ncbi:ArnT family glycosyltransferase [Novipirellula rosea]|uniref:Glycosyltransferase family 39 protein n=1 Tax=Novipirellula rosea TaxID=1031540 RepID=A0ABP8N0R6_9BACT